MTKDQRVPANIRAEVARRGLRQKDLAEMLGMSQASVSARLHGRVEFRLSEIEVLASIWGISLSYLLGEVAA